MALSTDIAGEPAARGFRRIALARSGARAVEMMAADVWSGVVETPSRDGAVVRHEARLVVDPSGAAHLHVLGERREGDVIVARHAALFSEEGGLSAALAAYDPARLAADFDQAADFARRGAVEALLAFADEADRVKKDVVALIDRLGRPH